VSFTASGPLAPPANATFRFLLPRNDSFLSWAQPCAIFKKARHPEAAKLYVSWLLSAERQAALAQWPVRRDVPAPGGFKPVFAYNTYPAGFRTFLQDRARLEKVRDQLEQLIGPMAGPNPTGVAGVFPEGGG
jgi:ABC-type Fe3+ transport system substrate-binding protein